MDPSTQSEFQSKNKKSILSYCILQTKKQTKVVVRNKYKRSLAKGFKNYELSTD